MENTMENTMETLAMEDVINAISKKVVNEVKSEDEKTIEAYNAILEEAKAIATDIIAKTDGNPLLLKKVINLLVDEKNQHLVAIEKKEKEFKSAEKAETKKKALEKCKALGTVNVGDYILCKSGDHTVIGKVKKVTDTGRYTIELDETFAKKIATGTRVIKSRSIVPTKVMRIFTSSDVSSPNFKFSIGIGLSEDDVKNAMGWSNSTTEAEEIAEGLTDTELEALGLTAED